MTPRPVPELLAPAGSLDAVRAAVANGANAVYLGAERFNARDDGAQLTLDELAQACALARGRGVRVYLTLNVLVKPAELVDALAFLGEAVDRGIDAVIVQDVGLVRLIRRVYPSLEIHGSTQMTVHDASGAAVMRDLGVERVVLARENTLDDVRAIREAVPGIGLETFVHGALCISYSGQCYMSGMISERSANRGSCAQSCRKDYVLTDEATGATLDTGYLISAKDLGAYDHLADIAAAGVGCLKIEGRKKKPEYVATVTRSYREFLDRVAAGDAAAPAPRDVEPLVQIFSRGFTGGMYGGRAGREYVTRTHPDNRGRVLGTVVASDGGEVVVDVVAPVEPGDGLGFEPPEGSAAASVGFAVSRVRTLGRDGDVVRQAIATRVRVPAGWQVVRSSHAALLERARASYASLEGATRERRVRLDARVFGTAGAPLKLVLTADGETAAARGEIPLVPASKRALDRQQLREQLGRLGDTPFALAAIDDRGLAPGLFLPVSELNRLRQQAVEGLLLRRDWAREATLAERQAVIAAAVEAVVCEAATASAGAADRTSDEVSAGSGPGLAAEPGAGSQLAGETAVRPGMQAAERGTAPPPADHWGAPPEQHDGAGPAHVAHRSIADVITPSHRAPGSPALPQDAHAPAASPFLLSAEVFTADDARAAAAAGATEVTFDPFLRHPAPPVSRLVRLAEELRGRGVTLRLRTPTIVRPEERRGIEKWLALELPVLSGHLGLAAELARSGRDVVADYGVNCFNQHAAAEYFRLGVRRIVLSVELTADEMAAVSAPWQGRGFDAVIYGRPEGMTIEHCVLSAAFDRTPTTCRDLCVQKHTRVTLTDPAGYTFPVATDAACRNRLLHSRPVDGSEYLPRLWAAGLRNFRLLFNVPGEPVGEIVGAYSDALATTAAGGVPDAARIRALLGGAFTRGHFARAV